MLNSKHHIRVCLLYEYKLGHNAVEATQNICSVVDQGVINTLTAYRWFERFRIWDKSLQGYPKSGRPSQTDFVELKQEIESELS